MYENFGFKFLHSIRKVLLDVFNCFCLLFYTEYYYIACNALVRRLAPLLIHHFCRVWSPETSSQIFSFYRNLESNLESKFFDTLEHNNMQIAEGYLTLFHC